MSTSTTSQKQTPNVLDLVEHEVVEALLPPRLMSMERRLETSWVDRAGHEDVAVLALKQV